MQYLHKKIDYTVPSGFEGGPGMGKQITPYVGTPYIDMTAAQFAAVGAAIGASLGDTWYLGGKSPQLGGNAFQFVRAATGLTLGQLVAVADPPGTPLGDQAVIVATVPGSSLQAVLTTYANAAFVGVNGDVDNWIYVDATGAATPQLRRIKANTSDPAAATYTVSVRDEMRPNQPFDQDQFDLALTNLDPIVIIRPWSVAVTGAASMPVGVALGTVTAGNYTIIQICGLASVSSDGTTPLVPNVPAIPGAVAGTITGTAADVLYTVGSNILPQIAQAAAGPVLIPCMVNFMAT